MQIRIFFAALALAVVVTSGAYAGSVRTQSAVVDLIADSQVIAPGVPFRAGVRVRLDPEWHTYWINPGEAGMASRVNWVLPPGFEAGPLQWPYPRRFVSDGIVGFGYEGEVMLFAEITPPGELQPGAPVKLEAGVELLLCKEICVPGSAKPALTLQSGNQAVANPEGAAALEHAASEVPVPLAEDAISARFEDGLIILQIHPDDVPGSTGPPAFFPEARNVLALEKEPVWFERNGGLEGQFPLSHLARGTPLRLRGALVWPGDKRPVAQQVDVRLRR